MSQTGKGTRSAGDLRSPFGEYCHHRSSSRLTKSLHLMQPTRAHLSLRTRLLGAPPQSSHFPCFPTGSFFHAPSLSSSISRAPEPPPPPQSPAAWSTSPFAFDNAGCPSTTASARSRATTLDALSDVLTLVSGRMRTPQSTRTSSAYVPRLSTSTSGLAVALERDLSAASAEVEVTTRTPSPAPTSSAGSTIEGVRISSWHSSDSEETVLIVRQ
ncbi:hypothetical protein OH76DRAFT_196351 [Lentinus brumalis]|uniref:Uncharacterized protein n=1 Tax=Lentinus brumalis TaxID=2498619 RepID=A0A371DI29_9APHY|nr:hypothetical protein OH76DRAFT_196351 [Polyporus brumalis]